MRFHLGRDSLIRAADERIPLFDLGIDPAVPAGPVGMLAKKTDASWNEEFQGTLKEWKD
jgi:hypothetical protein